MTIPAPINAVGVIYSCQKIATRIGFRMGSMAEVRLAVTALVLFRPLESRIYASPTWKMPSSRMPSTAWKPKSVSWSRNGNPITLTDGKMTRFIMSLEEAVDLVLFAFEKGESGDILVQKAPACTIQTQAEAVCELFGGDKKNIKTIGVRHGEKMYETLLTNEECARAEDLGNFYRVPCDSRNLNYDKYFTKGDVKRSKLTEFNSNNTELLDIEGVKKKLLELTYIQDALKGKFEI